MKGPKFIDKTKLLKHEEYSIAVLPTLYIQCYTLNTRAQNKFSMFHTLLV